MTESAAGVLDEPVARRREQRSWYVYDWANSAYATTTLTVLFGPYLTAVAKKAACPSLPSDAPCDTNLSVAGIPVRAVVKKEDLVGVVQQQGGCGTPISLRAGRKRLQLPARWPKRLMRHFTASATFF